MVNNFECTLNSLQKFCGPRCILYIVYFASHDLIRIANSHFTFHESFRYQIWWDDEYNKTLLSPAIERYWCVVIIGRMAKAHTRIKYICMLCISNIPLIALGDSIQFDQEYLGLTSKERSKQYASIKKRKIFNQLHQMGQPPPHTHTHTTHHPPYPTPPPFGQ